MNTNDPSSQNNTVLFFAVGDILLSAPADTDPFAHVLTVLKRSDLLFGNLEGPLSNRGKSIPGKCCIFSPSETAASLKSVGFDVLSLANNHMLDYGEEGLNDTLRILSENGIDCFGAGRNLREAGAPLIRQVNNLSIGFLGYSWYTGSVFASESHSGAPLLNEKIVLREIERLKRSVDVVIVSVHWGYEGERYPLPSHRKLAHAMIDAGAYLVLGHHPHVLQGIERYRKGMIVYSLGNFVFPDIFSGEYRIVQEPENKTGIIVSCALSANGIDDPDIIPVRANDRFQPVVLEGPEKQDVLAQIRELSEEFNDDYPHAYLKNRVRKDQPADPSYLGVKLDRVVKSLRRRIGIVVRPFLRK